MNSKNNRVNHDFQILYFLVGSCHTADGAYALLCDLMEERVNALNQVEANALRRDAKVAAANRVLANGNDEVAMLLAKADLAEVKGWEECEQRNIAAAHAELAFIKRCMDQLEQHRVFKGLHLPEAHEAAQRDEWRLELIRRAENYLLTQGTIPADEFNSMRCHPDFEKLIYPEIGRIGEAVKESKYLPSVSPIIALLPSP